MDGVGLRDHQHGVGVAVGIDERTGENVMDICGVGDVVVCVVNRIWGGV